MGVQKISAKWSSTSSYMSVTKPIWIPHGRPKDVLKVIVCQFLYDWHNTFLNTPLGVQKMSSKWSSTSSYLCVTKPIWTPLGRPKDVINVIVYQFLFEWHKTCLNTPRTSKRCPQWSSTSSYLAEPTLFEHPKDVRKMSSKWSSTSSHMSVTKPIWTPHGRPKDVLKVIVCQFLLIDTKPVWTPHGRPKDVLKVIVYQFLFKWPSTICTPLGRPKDVLKGIVYHFLFDWHKPFLNTSWTCVRCPQSDRLPVPTWLIQNLFEYPMGVQKISSKWSSTSSHMSVTKPIWTPHGRPKDVLKVIVCQFLLIDTKPVWTPHGRPKDVLKVIVYQFLFKWPSTICTPLGRPKDVLKGIV